MWSFWSKLIAFTSRSARCSGVFFASIQGHAGAATALTDVLSRAVALAASIATRAKVVFTPWITLKLHITCAEGAGACARFDECERADAKRLHHPHGGRGRFGRAFGLPPVRGFRQPAALEGHPAPLA